MADVVYYSPGSDDADLSAAGYKVYKWDGSSDTLVYTAPAYGIISLLHWSLYVNKVFIFVFGRTGWPRYTTVYVLDPDTDAVTGPVANYQYEPDDDIELASNAFETEDGIFITHQGQYYYSYVVKLNATTYATSLSSTVYAGWGVDPEPGMGEGGIVGDNDGNLYWNTGVIVKKSTDGGASWSDLYTFSVNPNDADNGPGGMVWDRTNDIIYLAGVEQQAADEGHYLRVYKIISGVISQDWESGDIGYDTGLMMMGARISGVSPSDYAVEEVLFSDLSWSIANIVLTYTRSAPLTWTADDTDFDRHYLIPSQCVLAPCNGSTYIVAAYDADGVQHFSTIDLVRRDSDGSHTVVATHNGFTLPYTAGGIYQAAICSAAQGWITSDYEDTTPIATGPGEGCQVVREETYLAYTDRDGNARRFFFDYKPNSILDIDGLGFPEMENITQRGPFQDGETYLSTIIHPRVINMTIRQQFRSRVSMLRGRTLLTEAIRPNNTTEPRLYFNMTDGSTRYTSVRIAQGPQFAKESGKWDSFAIQDTLRFIGYDPFFYDPITRTSAFTATGGTTTPQLVFPFQYPLTFGVIEFTPSTGLAVVTYNGDWSVFPILAISGPAANILIQNLTTDELIRSDADIQDSEVAIMDLRYARKSFWKVNVTAFATLGLEAESIGINLMPSIKDDSNLGTFHFVPGDNQLTIHASDTIAGNTTFVFQWWDRYLSLEVN